MKDWLQVPVPRYRRAVFLDRDGTINVDTHYPYKLEELELIPEAVEGLRCLATLALDVIVVANQAGIALGIFTREQMSKFNAEICSRIKCLGGRIDAFYFCPHLEPKNLLPGVSACECSKPAPGLLLEAAKDFELNLSRCFLVGDKTSDIAAGESVGCITILVKTGKAGNEEGALSVEPTYHAESLYEAAVIIQSLLNTEVVVSSPA